VYGEEIKKFQLSAENAIYSIILTENFQTIETRSNTGNISN
jgi:hypothetical protein